MPQEDGTLTQEEKDRIVVWLKEKRAVNPCPVCGHTHWMVGPQLALAPLFYPKRMIIGRGYPLAAVICGNCAFIRWHNAISMGLVVSETQTATEKSNG